MKTRKKRIRLNESQLQRIIKESVKKVLNELDGNSPENGYRFNWRTGTVAGQQGGAFHGSPLDIDRDEDQFEKQRRAERNSRLFGDK